MNKILLFLLCAVSSDQATANSTATTLDLTTSWAGISALIVFVVAYILVILEEKIHLRKSKPVMLAAAVIWIIIAIAYNEHGITDVVSASIRHTFLDYAELFFFLLVAMTYVNALLERGVFDALRNWLTSRSFSYVNLFWLTGFLAFFISPIADNLTTALIMCAVILSVGEGQPRFVAVACTNIVIAANAGGAFSPFGDITTLMVWQKGILPFGDFFALFIPSLVNYLVPAYFMQMTLPEGSPVDAKVDASALKYGGISIVFLFLLTIVTAVSFHSFLHIPPVFGMMAGLAYLKMFGFYLQHKSNFWQNTIGNLPSSSSDPYDFDVFSRIAKAEWDTLFFFYGIILSVGGLGLIGYLSIVSQTIYGSFDPTYANAMVGVLSAVVDNIPVMFAVLTMNPDMSSTQWLLVTLTAGVGGSLLSIGSAAGVALMGQARGQYTFFSHLRWTPVIALGYVASICVHLLIN